LLHNNRAGKQGIFFIREMNRRCGYAGEELIIFSGEKIINGFATGNLRPFQGGAGIAC
jgi:hypothetical protein